MTRTILGQIFACNSALVLFWVILVIYGKGVWQVQIFLVSRSYEIFSRYYENFSRLYEKISRYYKKISRSYEKYSRSYEKNKFFLLQFLTLVGFRTNASFSFALIFFSRLGLYLTIKRFL